MVSGLLTERENLRQTTPQVRVMGEDGAESIPWRYWLLIGGVLDPLQSFLSAQLDERRLEGERERRENEREII